MAIMPFMKTCSSCNQVYDANIGHLCLGKESTQAYKPSKKKIWISFDNGDDYDEINIKIDDIQYTIENYVEENWSDKELYEHIYKDGGYCEYIDVWISEVNPGDYNINDQSIWQTWQIGVDYKPSCSAEKVKPKEEK